MPLVLPSGGASQTVTTTYQGDENFVNPTKVALMDGYGNVVSESYYDGEVAEDNLLNKNIYEYDYQGNVIKTLGGRTYMENLGDYTTKTEYDYMGNPTKEYRADGSYITNTYDKMGNLTATTDYMGNTTTYTYDALSRVIKTTAPFEGDKTSETLTYYDNCGNVIKTKQQNNYLYGSATYRTTEHRYDNRNRHTITIANDGTQDIYTQYAYDGVGNVTQMITGQTERIYDMNGTLPSGATREVYEYDRFGNVIKTTDNEGRIATAEYNLIGKPLVETDKNGETKYTLYNPYGSPAMVEKGDFTQLFEYTANNLLLSVGTRKERLSNITYTYDKLGRVAREHKTGNLQGTPISDYTYDVNGNRKSYTLTYRGSQVYSANYLYDNLDRLTAVSYNDMDVSDISYNYDANNRVVSESTTDNTATYTYNSAGLVKSLVNSNGADFNYSYNVDGNQYQMQSDRGEWILYEYDGLGQLISENGMSEYVSHYKIYEYDTRGNRIYSESEGTGGQFTVSEYTYDSTNRLLTRKDTVGTEETNTLFQYDNNGSLVQKTKGNQTTTYTYNDFDELSGITTGDSTISYLYDATGKRSLEIKNGNYGIMIWDGDYVVAETVKNTTADASKPIGNKYFRGHKLFANKSTSGVGYYTYDAHGSVVGMSNESYVYDAFGNQITNTTTYNPFRYCGEYMEPDTGLIYLRNRYYDPSVGRFITEDPIKDGLNWYVYCGNNPVMYVDPTGLAPGDPFATADEAAADFGSFIGQKSIEEEEEYAAFIYKSVDENDNVYYYYDKPRNDYGTHEDRSTGFYISWSGTKPFAVTHTHGAYDANTNNTKDGFSSPGNSLNPNASDSASSDASGLDYYVVTPNGNLRRYTANSGEYEGVLINSDMPVDPNIEIHQKMQGTLLWNLLVVNFPNATAQDFVNARRNNPDSLPDTINALERFR